MRVKRRMLAVEFESVRPLLNISAERVEAARLVLVEGHTLQTAGNRFGWSRQAVGDTINVVWKTLENYRKAQDATASERLPPDWEKATLIAPRHLIDKFRGEIAQVVPQTYGSKQAVGSKKKAPRRKTQGPKVNVNETKEGSA